MLPATFDHLRRYAISRTLFAPTTLTRAIQRLGFLQADPIRAPARAQDLILRHRVKNYRAGDLERAYPRLAIEECFFINYGFLPRPRYELMQPRGLFGTAWDATTKKRAADLLRFVTERGSVHPREVEAHFAHGTVTNYWGGSSSATTHLLDKMHYAGMVRVVRRDAGVRVYAAQPQQMAPRGAREKQACLDLLVDLVVATYAPLPLASLNQLISRLRLAAPQWQADIKPALARAKIRLGHGEAAGTKWYWPADEDPRSARHAPDGQVRLLAPFDPLVWDRRRFELLWGWPYRFEAYTPATKRKLGYYALPLLWQDEVIGWANLMQKNGTLVADLGFVKKRPAAPEFGRELDAEVARLRTFLGLPTRTT